MRPVQTVEHPVLKEGDIIYPLHIGSAWFDYEFDRIDDDKFLRPLVIERVDPYWGVSAMFPDDKGKMSYSLYTVHYEDIMWQVKEQATKSGGCFADLYNISGGYWTHDKSTALQYARSIKPKKVHKHCDTCMCRGF